ncbi:DNA-directed RNA polymerase subunit beta [Candidatus Hodgkinia cicadicola]|uniref:DNA-directed RNA polymerase subunit beta n=1 Tax=Candidatus Hodgkinia cicadicola TaxID=573658 RepID=A0ABX4MID1_9HYPH|nr:DNA-directed RNA polymerase subunit beta [Candidatus Hodgkinia cicadicola]PIM96715.1 DNA-directed RNA polymerase subunit beta [Candidatus Hodgkinia cicadicola]
MFRSQIDGNYNNTTKELSNLYKGIYFDPIIGFRNNNVQVSKLKLIVLSLFPIIENWDSIDIQDIYVDIESSYYKINADIVYKRYSKSKDFYFINQSNKFKTVIVKTPKLSNSGTIILNGIERVITSQLIKQTKIKIRNTNKTIKLELNVENELPLEINFTGLNCNFYHNGNTVDYLSKLIHLGLKPIHLYKSLSKFNLISIFKQKWCKLTYNNKNQQLFKHSKRRKLRTTKQFQVLNLNNNIDSYYIPENHNNDVSKTKQHPFSNTFEKRTHVYPVVLPSHRLLPQTMSLFNSDIKDYSKITPKLINNIDLDFIGRTIIDSITNTPSNYDKLTKQDMIAIWNNMLNPKWIHYTDTDLQYLVKGIGDKIIETITSILTNTLQSMPIIDTLKNLLTSNELPKSSILRTTIEKLFTSSEFCQPADQTNSLATLSQKYRLNYDVIDNKNAIERSTRDVHRWHIDKICPIDSPEGENIGLSLSMATNSSVDINGLIISPYYVTKNNLISNKIIYLNHYEKINHNISTNKQILTTKPPWSLDNLNLHKSRNIHLKPISNTQFFSQAVNLIPFLNHNDPTRALMAANMLKQAVPLPFPQPPLIGTGEEENIIWCSKHNIVAKSDCVVVSADSIRVIVYDFNTKTYVTYPLTPSKQTNQGSCFRHRCVVTPLQHVKAGTCLAECQSSSHGELSLGTNLLVAFSCWNGFNYEDSILLSKNVVSRNIFNSIHIIELETNVHETPNGKEILTNKLKRPHKHLLNLSHTGIINRGSIVYPNDVLVGKLTPTDNTTPDNPTSTSTKTTKPNYIDTSLKVTEIPDSARVIDVIDSSDIKPPINKYIEEFRLIQKTYIRRILTLNPNLNTTTCTSNVDNESITPDINIQNNLNMITKAYNVALNRLLKRYRNDTNRCITCTTKLKSSVIRHIKIRLLIRRQIQVGDKVCGRHGNKGVISRIVQKQDMPYLADGTPIDIIINPLSMPSRMNLGQILETELGLISFKLGTEFKHMVNLYNLVENKTEIINLIYQNLIEMYPNTNIDPNDHSTLLRLANEMSDGIRFACPSFSNTNTDQINELSKRVNINNPSPKLQLYNGLTGLPFDQKTLVGIIYILKLDHMIDDKIHARSTGPYSIVTQQPLRGKANKGGQRLGEMEVWALQSYGVANIIKEVFTIKSDDIKARKLLHHKILSNKPGYLKLKTTWPESLLVLIKELFSICIKLKFNP